MKFQDMPAAQANALRSSSRNAPLSDPAVEYPEWYMHRWHFLPEGYLSRRSAAGYDRVIRNVYNAFSEHRIARDVLRRIRAFAPASVLEVGSGPGRLLERMARLRSAVRITGIELSPYLLERASARTTDPRIELVHGDATHLPVADGAFDLAVASHFVGHIPEDERQGAVGELARAVHPGGHVIIVDHRWHPWPETPALEPVAESFHALGAIRLRVFERVAA